MAKYSSGWFRLHNQHVGFARTFAPRTSSLVVAPFRICSQVSGHVFRRFEPTETAGEDGDEGYQKESDEACVRPVEDRIQPAIAAEPSEGSLDDPSDFGRNEFSFGAPHLGLDLDSKILPRGLQVFSLPSIGFHRKIRQKSPEN